MFDFFALLDIAGDELDLAFGILDVAPLN